MASKRTKRVYEVVNNNPHNNKLKVGKEELKFNENNFMYIEDEAKGQEIKKLYDGGDAVVNETEVYTSMEKGHNYFFAGVDSSQWKVWVLKNGKLRRVTKEEAKRKGYEIISSSKEKPKTEQERTTAQPQTVGGLDGL